MSQPNTNSVTIQGLRSELSPIGETGAGGYWMWGEIVNNLSVPIYGDPSSGMQEIGINIKFYNINNEIIPIENINFTGFAYICQPNESVPFHIYATGFHPDLSQIHTYNITPVYTLKSNGWSSLDFIYEVSQNNSPFDHIVITNQLDQKVNMQRVIITKYNEDDTIKESTLNIPGQTIYPGYRLKYMTDKLTSYKIHVEGRSTT